MMRWFFLFVIVASLVHPSLQAGEKIDRKTAEEIQAVKDFMNLTLSRRAFRQAPDLTGGEEKGKTFSGEGLSKTAGHEDRKSYFMNGNKISTEVYNFGG
ncbi:MAG: hypothetical protein WBG80_07575, partial [Bacteroidota bacterium]